MKFAHLADCHIGSWRDPKLNNISLLAFVKAVDKCIQEEVDFILISGDLFNTSMPGIDKLKETTKKFKELKDKGIGVYMIAGSHDFSPSGKTMLDVLENAGLCVNVAKGEDIDGKLRLKFTVDEKTKVKITGLLGKKGGLEKEYYKDLLREDLEKEEGFKIFLFHSLLSEFKPDELEKVDSQPLSLLPKNFNYYAGGHPHFIFEKDVEGFGKIAYPGPLFPNNFKELEKLGRGGFYIVNDKLEVRWEAIQVYNTFHIKLDCNHKTPEQVKDGVLTEIKDKEFNDTIVTIRLEGSLEAGKPTDIDFKDIFQRLYDKSAYFVMKNTAALVSKEFEEIKIDASSVEDVEESLIKEHLGQVKVEGMSEEGELTKQLMDVLGSEKFEGEKVAEFENRVKGEVEKVLKL